MYGRRGKVRISCECMGGEERYQSAVNVWEEMKGRNQLRMYGRREKRYESAVNVWEERKGTNQL